VAPAVDADTPVAARQDAAAAVAGEIVRLLDGSELSALQDYKLSTIERYTVDRLYDNLMKAGSRKAKG
jgi:hypothetical protein